MGGTLFNYPRTSAVQARGSTNQLHNSIKFRTHEGVKQTEIPQLLTAQFKTQTKLRACMFYQFMAFKESSDFKIKIMMHKDKHYT